jgi:hypothetical protein
MIIALIRYVPLFVLGQAFVVGGLILFGATLRKPKNQPATPRKSDLRELAARQTETKKMRIGGGVLFVFGAVLSLIS